MHFIIKYAAGVMSEWNLNPIAQNSETFLALSCNLPNKSASQIRFIDSLQFLQSSLDNLAKMMAPGDFILCSQLPQWEGAGMMKQVFPYSFVTDFAKLDEARNCLPPYEEFFDILRNKITVSREDYDAACIKYRAWGCTNMRDYF
jgi:hypothetical protein